MGRGALPMSACLFFLPCRTGLHEFNKDFRLNLNFGAQYYSGGDPHGLYGTAGVGASWTFVPHWSVISEVFALMGPGQTNPWFQSGLRYSPTKDIDFDV
jgi:hypothetical protein